MNIGLGVATLIIVICGVPWEPANACWYLEYYLSIIQEIIWRRIKWICLYSSVLNLDQLVVEGLHVSVDVDYIDSMNALAFLFYTD